MIVDAHFHAWRLDRGDYGWLTPALAPIYRDVTIEDWQREAAPLGVHAGVLVQAAPTEAETDYLLDLAEAHEAVRGVVGWIDLLAFDAPARIARLAARRKLKALRPMLHDVADPDWVLQPALTPAFEAMLTHDLAFDALIRPLHLPRVQTLCQRHPTLRVVIDHGAKPDIAHALWEPWASDIARLAATTGAVCKLSGLMTAADRRPVARWARHLIDSFGPQRVLWGSDWPVLELGADFRAWWNEVQALLAPLDEKKRAAVLGGNATRIYRL